MRVTTEHGYVLNKSKCKVKCNSCQILWMSLWQTRSTPGSIEGQCHQADTCTWEQGRATECLVGTSRLRVTTSHWNRYQWRISQLCQYVYKGCCLESQYYDFTLKYQPGEEIAITDTLSRYSPEDTPEIHLYIFINHVYITQEKKQDYQKVIQDDLLLHALADIIVSGWPEDIKDVPKSLWPYHGIYWQ